MAQKSKSALRETIEAIVVALLLALFIRTFIVQAFKIPSGSMEPTLLIGDHLLVSKFIYGIKNPFTDATLIPVKNPQRGDIIVFKYPVNPSQDFIKRVIGVAGDEVRIIDKQVLINGKPFEVEGAVHRDRRIYPRPSAQGGNPRDNYGPITVPENAVFVMGDNRDNSHDSRFWGVVDLSEIKGKAFILYWSWDKDASLAHSLRWDRIGDLIH